jgi:hypothetical protein
LKVIEIVERFSKDNKKKTIFMELKKEQTTSKSASDPVGYESVGNGIDDLLKESVVKVSNESSSAVATPQEIDTVMNAIMTQKKIAQNQVNYNKTLLTTAHLVQIGATSPKFAESRMVTDYGFEIRAGDLKEACKKNGITVRKYARGIRDQVIKVASAYNISGNLAKSYKLENPSCDTQDLIWVSDFQTFSENPAMPDHVRTWLLQNYKNRFRPDINK